MEKIKVASLFCGCGGMDLGVIGGFSYLGKEYKENPDHFKGNVADFTTVMRVVLTTSSMTPNLYDIMNILGRDRMLKRLEIFKEKGIILRKLAEYLLHRDH